MQLNWLIIIYLTVTNQNDDKHQFPQIANYDSSMWKPNLGFSIWRKRKI